MATFTTVSLPLFYRQNTRLKSISIRCSSLVLVRQIYNCPELERNPELWITFQFYRDPHDGNLQLALKLIADGNSIRSAQRITGLHRDTIMKLVASAGEKCVALLATKIRNVSAQDVQADEIWGFVGKKKGRKKTRSRATICTSGMRGDAPKARVIRPIVSEAASKIRDSLYASDHLPSRTIL